MPSFFAQGGIKPNFLQDETWKIHCPGNGHGVSFRGPLSTFPPKIGSFLKATIAKAFFSRSHFWLSWSVILSTSAYVARRRTRYCRCKSRANFKASDWPIMSQVSPGSTTLSKKSSERSAFFKIFLLLVETLKVKALSTLETNYYQQQLSITGRDATKVAPDKTHDNYCCKDRFSLDLVLSSHLIGWHAA